MLNMPLVGDQDFALISLPKLHLPLQELGVRDMRCSDCLGCPNFMTLFRLLSLEKRNSYTENSTQSNIQIGR